MTFKPALISALLGGLATFAAVPALAADAPVAAKPPVLTPMPRAYAGYAQNVVVCANANATQTSCTVPAMTAGRYIIDAMLSGPTKGPATATQSLQLGTSQQTCGKTPKLPVAGVPPRLRCVVEFLTDQPLKVDAVLTINGGAVADARGLSVSVTRLPWDGVVSMRGFAVKPRAAAAATPAPTKPKASAGR